MSDIENPNMPAWAVTEDVDRALRACEAERCVLVQRATPSEATVCLVLLTDLPANLRPTPTATARWLVIIDVPEDQTLFFAISPRGAIS
jgi:hypothetical protein